MTYLNLDSNSTNDTRLLGKAIAMNARRNGSLKSVSIERWLNTALGLKQFIESMYISEKDHELWYGDSKLASEMKEGELVKHLHTNLTFLNIMGSPVGGMNHNFKEIEK